jgi:hypothetical protein
MARTGKNSVSVLMCNWQCYETMSRFMVCHASYVNRAYLEANIADLMLAENNIMVRLPDNVVAGHVTTWTAVFLTCTLAILEVIRASRIYWTQ